MQNENSELNEQYSISETGEKTKSSDQKEKLLPQTKTKDILKVGLQLVFHKLLIISPSLDQTLSCSSTAYNT